MAESTASLQAQEGERARTPRRPRALLWRRAAAFTLAAGLIAVLAIDGGGYDIVTRQEMGIAVWAAIALGFAFGVLPRGHPTRGAWVVLGSIGALAALTLLALAWTESDGETFAEFARVVQYAGLLTLAYTALNRDTWRAAAAGLATAALAIPLLSLVSRLAPDLIVDHAARELRTDRLSYPFDYWNAVAAWGAMAIAIGLVWSAHARHAVVRALALAAVPAAVLSVYLTYSRGGVIASATALVAAVALSRNRWTVAAHALVAAGGGGLAVLAARDHEQIARATGDDGAGAVVVVLVLAAVACAAIAVTTRLGGTDRLRLAPNAARVALGVGLVAVALVAVAAHSQLEDAWNDFRHERTVAVGEDPAIRLTTVGANRYEIWSTAVDAFESDPVRGIGPGSFEFFWSREGDDPQFIRDAHSVYLEQLAELGVPGLLALLAVLGSLLATALAARRRLGRDEDVGAAAAAIAAFIVFLLYAGIDWIWELPAIGALALGGAAVAGAASFPRWGPQRLSAAPRVTLIAVALAAVLVQVPGLVSTERLRASGDELRGGSVDRASELADEAVRAEPWAAAPYVQRALVEQRQGDLAAARTDAQRAIDRERTNWRHHIVLARIEAQAGDRAAVRAQLAEARRLAPDSALLLPSSPLLQEINVTLIRPR
ncbi:MAG: O-antigen ligase family protein [Solirubrobacterales bacterium]